MTARTQDMRYKYPISNCLTVSGSFFYLPFRPLHLLLSKVEEGEVKSKCPVKEYDSPDVCPGRGREERYRRSKVGRKGVRGGL